MRTCLLVVAVHLSLTAFANGQPATDSEAVSRSGTRIFDSATKIIEFDLAISGEQFDSMNPRGGGTFAPTGFGSQQSESKDTHANTFGVQFPWAKGNLTFDGKASLDVGVRYKGNFTFMASGRSLKKSLKVDFDRYVDDQKLDGLAKLNFHCGVSDPFMAREALSYIFFKEVGVPVPRTTFAVLYLTIPDKYERELVGVYTLVEQVNKTFLKENFGDGKGLLLKPEGLQGGLTYLGKKWKAYEKQLRPESSASDDEKERLIAFAKLISNASDEDFAKDVGTYLDVEAFLKFIAANALLSNLDSYLGFGHNYYLYLVPSTNKFVFIPWDLDLSLAAWPAVGTPEQLVKLSIEHPHAGKNLLLDRVFAVPSLKARYLEIVKQMLASHFTTSRQMDTLDQIDKVLEEPRAKEKLAVQARKERANGLGMGFGGGQFGQSLPPRQFIEQRILSVNEQLEGKSDGFIPKPFGPPGFGGFGPRP